MSVEHASNTLADILSHHSAAQAKRFEGGSTHLKVVGAAMEVVRTDSGHLGGGVVGFTALGDGSNAGLKEEDQQFDEQFKICT